MNRPEIVILPGADRGTSDTRQARAHIERCGDVDYLVNGSSSFAAGTKRSGGQSCAVVTLLRKGSICIGLEHSMSAAEAREVAAALIECAEELEAEAATIAAGAFNKAAGR